MQTISMSKRQGYWNKNSHDKAGGEKKGWGEKIEKEESEITHMQDILYSGSVRIRDRAVLKPRDPTDVAAVLLQHFPLSQVW